MKWFIIIVGLMLIAGCQQQTVKKLSNRPNVIADWAAKNALSQWKVHSFVGQTHYSITRLEDDSVLRAQTSSAASALYKEVSINLDQTPRLSWRWRTALLFPGLDPDTKFGDDYVARIYVVVKNPLNPFQSKTLN